MVVSIMWMITALCSMMYSDLRIAYLKERMIEMIYDLLLIPILILLFIGFLCYLISTFNWRG